MDNSKVNKKFGFKWNNTTHLYHVYDNGSNELVIARPFSGKDITITRTDARSLKRCIDKFLLDKK